MNAYAEERAAAIQLYALRLRGFPPRSSVTDLAAWLDACLRIEHCECERSALHITPEGRGHLTLPAGLEEESLTEKLLHEIAHYLCAHGAAALFWRDLLHSPEYQTRRLARRWTAVEEAEVRSFVEAWFLPSWLMYGPDELIAEEAQADVLLVRERRRNLHGREVRLGPQPCRWAAWWAYRLQVQRGGLLSAVVVTPLSGGPGLVFPAAEIEETLRELRADLVALTPVEFGLKHDRAASGELEVIADPGLAELLR